MPSCPLQWCSLGPFSPGQRRGAEEIEALAEATAAGAKSLEKQDVQAAAESLEEHDTQAALAASAILSLPYLYP